MFQVKHAVRTNRERMGDIIELSRVRQAIQLIPKMGAQADRQLTSTNSLEACSEYYINNFSDKEVYFSVF